LGKSTVEKRIYEMMKFWFDKGVDGFRMDAITYIAKDENFPSFTEERYKNNTVSGQAIMPSRSSCTITWRK
jgi:Glycosidases